MSGGGGVLLPGSCHCCTTLQLHYLSTSASLNCTHLPCVCRLLQKKVAAREEASLAHERAALQLAQELEARVAGFDAKEKKALRVGGAGWDQQLLAAAHTCAAVLPATPSAARLLPWGFATSVPTRLLLQELAERETALAGKESKLAAQHAELAERAAAQELAKSRVEADRRALEQREESLQLAQAEVGQAGSYQCAGAGICPLLSASIPLPASQLVYPLLLPRTGAQGPHQHPAGTV